MKQILAAALFLPLVLAGCSQGGEEPTPEPTINIIVANQAGIPLEGVKVQAQQLIGTAELVDLPSTDTTDAGGNATLTMPVNAIASIGLSIDDTMTAWENTLIVPAGGATLYYQFPVTLGCATVDPSQPSSCPALPAPTSELTITPSAQHEVNPSSEPEPDKSKRP